MTKKSYFLSAVVSGVSLKISWKSNFFSHSKLCTTVLILNGLYESRNASSDISSPHFDMNEQIYWVSKLSSINIMKFQTPSAIWIWKGNWIFGHIFSLRMRQETARIKTFPPKKSTWMNRARIKKVLNKTYCNKFIYSEKATKVWRNLQNCFESTK